MSQAVVEKDLVFPLAEYRRRLDGVQDGIERLGADAALVFGPENLFYLTGYQTIGYSAFQLALVPAGGEPQLLVRELERGAARRLSWMSSEPLTVQDGADPIAAVVEALRQLDLDRGRLAVDRSSWFLTVNQYLELVGRLPAATIVDGSGLVERVRRVKSELELDCIRRAAGSEYMSIAPIVTAGYRSGIAHTTFARHRIARGDAVLLEMGAAHHRYAGPLMRSAVVGPPSDLVRRMYDACSRALDAAIAAIRPGVTAGSVHDAGQRVIDQAGFEPNFRKRLGYSVGVGFAPDWGEGHILHLSREDPTVLEPGMVFHLPPALRRYAVVGVGCSETVAVTADGVEVITDFPRELAIR